MAKINELDELVMQEWLETRPQVIKDMVKSHPPNLLYRMKSSGHRVVMYSYNENGTVTVVVLGKYNKTKFERRVFGIELSDLTECDLPEEGEELGAELTSNEDIDEHIKLMRENQEPVSIH